MAALRLGGCISWLNALPDAPMQLLTKPEADAMQNCCKLDDIA